MKRALMLLALLGSPAFAESPPLVAGPLDDEKLRAICALALRGVYVAATNSNDIPHMAEAVVWCITAKKVDGAEVKAAGVEFRAVAKALLK